MKKHIVFVLFAATILYGCPSSNRPAPQVADVVVSVIPSEIDKTFYLSQLYANYEIIPLGSTDDVLVGNPNRIVSFGDRYYVGDGLTYKQREQRLHVFSKTGEYLHSIGQRGRGPGEYISLYDFSISPDPVLYLLDRDTDRVLRYRLDGAFIDEFEVNIKATNIEVDDNRIYLYANGWHPFGEREEAWQLRILDREGNEQARLLHLDDVRAYPAGSSVIIYPSRAFSPTEDGILFSMPLHETVYLLEGENATPWRTLDFGRNRIPDSFFAQNGDSRDFSELLRETQYAKNIHNVFKVGDVLFFNFHMNNRRYQIAAKDDEAYNVKDDILGLMPDLHTFIMNKNEYIGVFSQTHISFMLNGSYSDFKEKLTASGITVDEDSNPLLVRYWN